MKRVLIISDVHANLLALDAIQRQLVDEPLDAVWFLGDAVGYGPYPDLTLETLADLLGAPGTQSQSSDHVWLAGNHDWALIGRGLSRDRQLSPEAAGSHVIHQQSVPLTCPEFVSALQTGALPTCQPAPYAGVWLAHACYTNTSDDERRAMMLWQYPRYEAEVEKYVYLENYETWTQHGTVSGPLLTCAGHWHARALHRRHLTAPQALQNGMVSDAPWTRMPISEEWQSFEPGYIYHLNPGSVGFPVDSDGRPSYTLLEWDERPQRVRFGFVRRSEYDIEAVRAELTRLGYPEAIASKKLLNCTDFQADPIRH